MELRIHDHIQWRLAELWSEAYAIQIEDPSSSFIRKCTKLSYIEDQSSLGIFSLGFILCVLVL